MEEKLAELSRTAFDYAHVLENTFDLLPYYFPFTTDANTIVYHLDSKEAVKYLKLLPPVFLTKNKLKYIDKCGTYF